MDKNAVFTEIKFTKFQGISGEEAYTKTGTETEKDHPNI